MRAGKGLCQELFVVAPLCTDFFETLHRPALFASSTQRFVKEVYTCLLAPATSSATRLSMKTQIVHARSSIFSPLCIKNLIHITICQGYLLPCKVKHHEASKPRSRGHDQFSAIATRCALTRVLPLSPFSLGIVHMHATHAHTYYNPSVSVGCSEAVRKSIVSVAGT